VTPKTAGQRAAMRALHALAKTLHDVWDMLPRDDVWTLTAGFWLHAAASWARGKTSGPKLAAEWRHVERWRPDHDCRNRAMVDAWMDTLRDAHDAIADVSQHPTHALRRVNGSLARASRVLAVVRTESREDQLAWLRLRFASHESAVQREDAEADRAKLLATGRVWKAWSDGQS
jgi:hypothetical protein